MFVLCCLCDLVIINVESLEEGSYWLYIYITWFAAKCIPLGAPLPTPHLKNYNSFEIPFHVHSLDKFAASQPRGLRKLCWHTPEVLGHKEAFKTKHKSWGARNQWWHIFQQMTILSSYVQVAWGVFAKMWKQNPIESLSWLSVLSSHLSAKTLMAPSPLSSHFLGSPLPGRAVVTEGHFSLVKQNQRLIRMNWL